MMFCAAYCMISRPVTVSPVKATLAIRGLVASALPISAPGPVTMFSTPGGRMSPITSASLRIDHGVGRGGLEDRGVPCRQRRRQLPGRHQQREVERDDLADHAQRLVEVVGDGLAVDLGDRALLGADRRREIAEVIGRQRDVGGQRLPDRLAVLPALGDGEHLPVRVDGVGDRVQHLGALGRRRLAPVGSGRVRRVQGVLDVLRRGLGDLADRPRRGRAQVDPVFPVDRRQPLAADEVVVSWLDSNDAAGCSRCRIFHLAAPSLPPASLRAGARARR